MNPDFSDAEVLYPLTIEKIEVRSTSRVINAECYFIWNDILIEKSVDNEANAVIVTAT